MLAKINYIAGHLIVTDNKTCLTLNKKYVIFIYCNYQNFQQYM